MALIVVATIAGCAVEDGPQATAEAEQSGLPSPSQSAAPTPSATPTLSATPTVTATPIPTQTTPPPVTPTPIPTTSEKPKGGFDINQRSIDDPASYWVVSDKLRPLKPSDWSPSDIITVPVKSQNPPRLRKAAGDALVKMFDAAADEGAGQMQVQSAWRSYDVQVKVYNGWVASLGKKQADAQSARPGFSEHQTGLAVDISPVPLSCALDSCFGDTKQGEWLAENAWRFGYLLRYPADKVEVTGFTYEPWHFRFIGQTLSTEMHEQGVTTLEEFFDLPPAPDYAKKG